MTTKLTETIRLIVEKGDLLFPQGGYDLEANRYDCEDRPSLLLRIYGAGDCDTCPWPMTSAEHRERLAVALYDERETNAYFPLTAKIELPDGTPFDIEANLPRRVARLAA